ncbi:MAG: hypothetical protein AAGC68_14480 [Verrucomicrobiota bacterium]
MGRTYMGKSFPETRWSLIVSLREGDEQTAVDAMERICHDYWLPLYSFLRIKGDSQERAEDIVQGFFLDMLTRDGFAQIETPDTGTEKKLRSFLLACLKNYRAKVYRAETAEKRGGKDLPVTIDTEMAERRLADVTSHQNDPEKAYDQAWALNLIRHATSQVERDYAGRGKEEVFQALEPLLAWNATSGGATYAEVASSLGTNEQSVKTGVHRLRKRVREAIKNEIARTIDSDEAENVEEELVSLFAALG